MPKLDQVTTNIYEIYIGKIFFFDKFNNKYTKRVIAL